MSFLFSYSSFTSAFTAFFFFLSGTRLVCMCVCVDWSPIRRRTLTHTKAESNGKSFKFTRAQWTISPTDPAIYRVTTTKFHLIFFPVSGTVSLLLYSTILRLIPSECISILDIIPVCDRDLGKYEGIEHNIQFFFLKIPYCYIAFFSSFKLCIFFEWMIRPGNQTLEHIHIYLVPL